MEEIVYKTVGDVTLKLHVFAPVGPAATDRRPAIVFFFGGGWKDGTPTQFYPQCRHLAEQGMVAISAEYRVENRHGTTPRECVQDGKSAIRWVRRHAAELGINPKMIAAGGGSAGAQVAAAAALVNGFEEASEDCSVSCRPDALVLFNPVFDNGPRGYGHDRVKDYWEAFSPLHNINRTAPPTVLFFGTNDKFVPVATAERYKLVMVGNGCRCDLHLYPGQGYGFFNFGYTTTYDDTLVKMDSFLESLGYLPPLVRAGEEGLPQVFLIGDSISLGYTEPVAKVLEGVCRVRRAPDNCGDTRRGLQSLEIWLGDQHWDVIHFNWGLHDLCYRHRESKEMGNRDKIRGNVSVPLEEYRQNLEKLVERLKARGSRLVWASTTFIPEGEPGRHQGDERQYNEVAAAIMNRQGIPINDLHALTVTFGADKFTGPGDVHFTEAGSRAIAEQVAKCIRERLTDCSGTGEGEPIRMPGCAPVQGENSRHGKWPVEDTGT
jgi:acetyl esterase/lipase